MIKNGFSLYAADQLMGKCHSLRLQINKVHECGRKGSWEKESDLLHEYDHAIEDLFKYLKEHCDDI